MRWRGRLGWQPQRAGGSASFVPRCAEVVKGLLRTAGLSTRFGEEDEAAWGRRAKVSAEKLRQLVATIASLL